MDGVDRRRYDASLLAHPFLRQALLRHERELIQTTYLPRAETWAYVRENQVVGFVALLESEIGGLSVASEDHRRGIGRALVDRARSRREDLEADVFEATTIGRRVYERYGFRRIGRSVRGPSGHVMLRMQLRARRNVAELHA